MWGLELILCSLIMHRLAQLKGEAKHKTLRNPWTHPALWRSSCCLPKHPIPSTSLTPTPHKADTAFSKLCTNVVQVFVHLGGFQNILKRKLNSEQATRIQVLCQLSGKAEVIFFVPWVLIYLWVNRSPQARSSMFCSATSVSPAPGQGSAHLGGCSLSLPCCALNKPSSHRCHWLVDAGFLQRMSFLFYFLMFLLLSSWLRWSYYKLKVESE